MSETQSSASSSSRTHIRQVVLVVLLLLMIGALWYDYKVARPAVADAYARIEKLNSEINGRSGMKYMTEQDVQGELKRMPIETFSENGYFVEVYGWRSGLPTRHHKYFAVYTEGTPHVFKTHAMTEFDKELVRIRTISGLEGAAAEMPVPPMTPGPGFVPGEDFPGEQPPAGEGAAPTPQAAVPADAPQPTPPAEDKPAEPAADDAPAVPEKEPS